MILFHIHAHEARHAVVLGGGAHRTAELGAGHQQHQAYHDDGRGDDGGDLDRVDEYPSIGCIGVVEMSWGRW